MKLTIGECMKIAAAIAALGREPAPGKMTPVPCRFAAQTRLKLARNLRVLQGHGQDYESAHRALILEIEPKGYIDREKSPEQSALYNRRHAELLDLTVDVDLAKVSVADLDLDTNQIAPDVLAALLVIVED